MIGENGDKSSSNHWVHLTLKPFIDCTMPCFKRRGHFNGALIGTVKELCEAGAYITKKRERMGQKWPWIWSSNFFLFGFKPLPLSCLAIMCLWCESVSVCKWCVPKSVVCVYMCAFVQSQRMSDKRRECVPLYDIFSFTFLENQARRAEPHWSV